MIWNRRIVLGLGGDGHCKVGVCAVRVVARVELERDDIKLATA